MNRVKHLNNIDHGVNNIIYAGDSHGNLSGLIEFINNNNIENTIIVHVGDFNIGVILPEDYNTLNKVLYNNNVFLYIVRGNHDDPAEFINIFYRTNIFLIADYTVINFIVDYQPINIFCLGGAISVDRIKQQERQQTTWWADEIVDYNYTEDDLDSIIDINVIVTHTAPEWLPPFTKSPIVSLYLEKDPTIESEIDAERKNMGILINKIIERNRNTLEYYYYGHFHFSEVYYQDNISFRLLGIDEYK